MQRVGRLTGQKVQPIDFLDYFVHLTFTDKDAVWQDGTPRWIAFVSHAAAISPELSATVPETWGLRFWQDGA
jgi:hypothetical protein